MKWKRLLQFRKITLFLYGICCLWIVQILYVSRSVRLVEKENEFVLNAVDNRVLTSKGMYANFPCRLLRINYVSKSEEFHLGGSHKK